MHNYFFLLPDPIPYLGWDARGIGRNLTFSGGLGVVCFVIIFIKESKILGWIRYYVCCHFRAKGNESSAQNAAVDEEGALVDSDVLLENMRIRNTKLKQMNNTDNLILRLLYVFFFLSSQTNIVRQIVK